MDPGECLSRNLQFKVIKAQSDSSPLQCSHVNRNQSWRSAFMMKQTLLLDIGCMANVRFIEILDFDYGCEMTVAIAECRSGPYTNLHHAKYFCRKQRLQRIPLGSLPCRYIKLIATKGVHINPKKISLIGAKSEELQLISDENETFKLLVANPQRIMYQ